MLLSVQNCWNLQHSAEKSGKTIVSFRLGSSKMQCGTDFLHLSLELTRLLLLDGGEVGVPHKGDQVGEEHPVLWSHQVDVHNLRKIYVGSVIAFVRQF